MTAPPEPGRTRLLGRSRAYSATDMPERLRRWHAPRANRWECLSVSAGALTLEWLGSTPVARKALPAGACHWIAPGTRWRVAHLAPDTQFVLEVHAQNPAPKAAPHRPSAALLDRARPVAVADETALCSLIDTFESGERCLVGGNFDSRHALRVIMTACDGALAWHPLDTAGNGFTAFLSRAARPLGLADYLSRDHAVVEAALAGALRGDTRYERWLHTALVRHIAIEEQLLFPVYLRAGGREAWVRGLKNEHVRLRQYLQSPANPTTQHQFRRLLDGHDEKEERIVYPDIIAHLALSANGLLESAMRFPIPGSAAGARPQG